MKSPAKAEQCEYLLEGVKELIPIGGTKGKAPYDLKTRIIPRHFHMNDSSNIAQVVYRQVEPPNAGRFGAWRPAEEDMITLPNRRRATEAPTVDALPPVTRTRRMIPPELAPNPNAALEWSSRSKSARPSPGRECRSQPTAQRPHEVETFTSSQRDSWRSRPRRVEKLRTPRRDSWLLRQNELQVPNERSGEFSYSFRGAFS